MAAHPKMENDAVSATHFWLIRHGETRWNAERRLQGWRDIELNEVGRAQAKIVARYLASDRFTARVDVILSSDLSRARDTARQTAEHFSLPVQIDKGLRERSFGIYEGHDWTTLLGSSSATLNLRDPRQEVEDGESLLQFQDRIISAFEDLAQRHVRKNVLVFTHGGVIDMVWRKATRTPLEAPRPEPILNASVNQFAIGEDRVWRLTDWGRADHLEPESAQERLMSLPAR